MAILITSLIVLSAFMFLYSRIKKSQDADRIENYGSTDEASCRETHGKFWTTTIEDPDQGTLVFSKGNWCPICEQIRL